MLTCLPAACCCSADLLHYSPLMNISLFDIGQQQSWVLLNDWLHRSCLPRNTEAMACLLHSPWLPDCISGEASAPPPTPLLLAAVRWVVAFHLMDKHCCYSVLRAGKTRVYHWSVPQIIRPSPLTSPRVQRHTHTPSHPGPSTASNADVLSYPALTDNGNGLIKKAVDRMNHSFPQASSLALPQ